MTKKEIIKELDLEVGLFDKTENENSLGELYLTNVQFKEAEKVLWNLKKRSDGWLKALKELREIIDGEERFSVWKEGQLNEKHITSPHPIIILGGFISNNVFQVPDLSGCLTSPLR